MFLILPYLLHYIQLTSRFPLKILHHLQKHFIRATYAITKEKDVFSFSPFFARLVKQKPAIGDCGRFIVSIGSVSPGRFGKGEKFFEKILHLSIPSRTKTKQQRGCLCLNQKFVYDMFITLVSLSLLCLF